MAEWNDKLKEHIRTRYSSMHEAARQLGISRSTLKDYVAGKITQIDRISPERRAVLYRDTSIEELKPDNYEAVLENLNKPKQAMQELTNQKLPRDDLLKRRRAYQMGGAKLAVDLFYGFAEQMGEISGNPEAVKEVSRGIDPRDAGLVLSYLNALFLPEGDPKRYVFSQPFALRGGRK